MSENEDQGSKTQEPTERKLKKAREKGDVPISKEVGHLFIYLAILVAVAVYAPAQAGQLASALGQIFMIAPGVTATDGLAGIADILMAAQGILLAGAVFLGGVLGILLIAALASGAGQGPLVFSPHRMKPKFSKMNPLKGITRILGGQNLFEFAKSLVKLVILVAISLWLVWNLMDGLLPGGIMNPEDTLGVITSEAVSILAWIAALMIPVVLVDYTWKRISHRKKQMMTMKELRDEHKESEGDPQIKGKRQQIRQKMAQQRISQSVPTATLVVTNPTHYAVALRYERGRDHAPVCVAKGADLVAARIRAIAHENEIPVIESRALARALHAAVEVDEVIPEAHWAAVAELVGFVFDLRRKIRRKPPEGASLRDD